MVVVKKKKGESVDTLLHRFNKQTREENVKWDVERRKRYMRPAELKKEKSKEKARRKAYARRRYNSHSAK